MGIQLLRNEQRLGSREVEHEGGRAGWEREVPFLCGVRSEIFDDLPGAKTNNPWSRVESYILLGILRVGAATQTSHYS